MRPFSINIRGKLQSFDRPVVMGVINLTPDSFYADSRIAEASLLEEKIVNMVNQGAGIIDVGAFSTRPGSKPVSLTEEIERLEKAVSQVRQKFPDTIFSIDTFRSEVALRAVDEWGFDIVNDISGGNYDDRMFETIARLNCPYVLTHSSDTFDTMHVPMQCEDILAESLRSLSVRISRLEELGVNDIIVDPGIGFAKTMEQNYTILRNLDTYHVLHKPLLIGVSRKSMITKLLNISPDEALSPTVALNAFALDRGADILRIHDVAEAYQTVTIYHTLTHKSLLHDD